MKTLVRSAALLATLMPLGCEEGQENTRTDVPEGAPIEQLAQPLTGPLSFEGCDAIQVANVTAAIGYARQRVSQASYRQCIVDSIPIDAGNQTAEDIVRLSNTALPVEIVCEAAPCGSSGYAGCAGAIGGGDPERFSLLHSHARTGAPEAVAGTILHEIMHNHSFGHPHYVGFAVPDIVASCARDHETQGAGRSELSDQVELAHAGAFGGGLRITECPDNTVAVGVRGAIGPTLERYGLRCAPVADGALGAAFDDDPLSPPAGATVFANECGPGEVITGAYFYGNSFVNRAWGRCTRLEYVLGDSPVSGGRWTPGKGTIQGGDFAQPRYCPPGKAVVGLRMTEGALVDSIKLVCDDVRRGRERTTLASAQVGGNGGFPAFTRCTGNTVLTGLYGQRGNGVLNGVGGTCFEMVGDVRGIGVSRSSRADAIGGDGGDRFSANCADDEVVVGVRTRADNEVRDVLPLCVEYVAWRDEAAVATTPVGAAFVNGGTQADLKCARGEVAVGLEGRAAARIDQLRVLCQEPEPSMVPTALQPVGGVGGAAAGMFCGGDGMLRGIRGRVSAGGELAALGAVCGPMRGDAVPGGADRLRDPIGGAKRTGILQRECGPNQVVVGLAGTSGALGNLAHVVRSVRPVCAPLSNWRQGVTSGVFEQSNMGQSNQGNPFIRMCEPGEAVMGWSMRYGGLVDQIELTCGRLDLVPGESIEGTLSGPQDVQLYRISVPAGVRDLRVTLDGPAQGADFDLYVRQGLRPLLNRYDDRGYTNSADETVQLDGDNDEDIYFVLVRAYGGSGDFTLQVSGDEALGCQPVEEICNQLDDDCDGIADEEDVCTTRVQVQVRRLRALSQDSCNGSMDFFGALTLRPIGQVGTTVNFGIIEGDDIAPFWTIEDEFDTQLGAVEAVLLIRDEDDFFCGGSDDTVDVHPAGNLRVPAVRIDFGSGEVRLTSNNSLIGQVGQDIELAGTQSDETGRMTFRVEVD